MLCQNVIIFGGPIVILKQASVQHLDVRWEDSLCDLHSEGDGGGGEQGQEEQGMAGEQGQEEQSMAQSGLRTHRL